MNITLRVDDEVVRKVRKIAADRSTTLAAMVRGFLESVARRDEAERRRALADLEQTFETHSRDMGSRAWRRDELYARRDPS